MIMKNMVYCIRLQAPGEVMIMKKTRLTALLLLFVLMASVLPMAALADSFKVGDNVVVKVDTLLRYRSGWGTDYPCIAKYPNGTKAKVLEVSPKGLWYRCEVGTNTKGWFYGGYLKLDKAAASTATGKYVVSNRGMFVNLRATAGGTVLAMVPDGATVNVVSSANGWSYVKYGTQDGYMMSHFLVKK